MTLWYLAAIPPAILLASWLVPWAVEMVRYREARRAWAIWWRFGGPR